MRKHKYSNLKQESKTFRTVFLQKVKQTKTKKLGVRQPKMPSWFKNWSDTQFQPLVETVKQQGKKIDSLDKKLNRVIKLNKLKA